MQNLGFNYRPQQVDFALHLFKAEELTGEFNAIAHPNNYWQNYTDKTIYTYLVKGNHDTLLQNDYAVSLADCIITALHQNYNVEI